MPYYPYKTLAKNHHIHHSYPASDRDPDFYQENPHNFWLWYFSFMKDYQQGKQFWILFWGMTVIFWILIFFAGCDRQYFLILGDSYYY